MAKFALRLNWDELGPLNRLAAGGQGVVYSAPGVRLPSSPSLVYKEYKGTFSAVLQVDVLESMANYLGTLPFTDGVDLLARAAWPCALVESADTVRGFLMPAIPGTFYADMRKVSGVQTALSEFQHLLNEDNFLARRGISLTDRHKYELIGSVARALSLFHRHDICVGDVSPKNMLYSLEPIASVFFVDCDSMRFRGRSALPQLETPDWDVRSSGPSEELGTPYSDSYKLGLLALRLLAGNQATRDVDRLPSTVPREVRQLISEAISAEPTARPKPASWESPIRSATAVASTELPQVLFGGRLVPLSSLFTDPQERARVVPRSGGSASAPQVASNLRPTTPATPASPPPPALPTPAPLPPPALPTGPSLRQGRIPAPAWTRKVRKRRRKRILILVLVLQGLGLGTVYLARKSSNSNTPTALLPSRPAVGADTAGGSGGLSTLTANDLYRSLKLDGQVVTLGTSCPPEPYNVGQRFVCTAEVDGVLTSWLFTVEESGASRTRIPAGSNTTTTGSTPPAGGTPLKDLKRGDCFNISESGLAGVVVLVACNQPHTDEVVGVNMLAGDRNAVYPGASAIIDIATRTCSAQANEFVGGRQLAGAVWQSFSQVFSQAEVGWNRGERTLVCTLREMSGAKRNESYRLR